MSTFDLKSSTQSQKSVLFPTNVQQACSLSLTLTPSIIFVFTLQSSELPDRSQVSSFYGPGAFTAWLCGVLYTLFAYITNVHRNDARTPRVTWPDWVIFIPTTTYAAIAAIDATLKLIPSSRESDAPLEAAATVSAYAYLACVVALALRGPRGAVSPWLALAYLTLLPTFSYYCFLFSSSAGLLKSLYWVKMGVTFMLGFSFGVENQCQRVSFLRLAGFLGVSGFMAALQYLRWWKTELWAAEMRVVWNWPRTAAGWSDLGQVAVLSAAVAALVLRLGYLKRRTGFDSEFEGDTEYK